MRFREKSVVIDAVQFNGKNQHEICNFTGYAAVSSREYLTIDTLEWKVTANKGDWIIKGVNGEFYSCKPDIFEATYEKADA